MMGVLNFAHASFYMLGAYFGYQISQYVGFWPAWSSRRCSSASSARSSSASALRNVHRHGHVAELLFTFGLAFVIEEVVQMVWGKLPVDLPRAGGARLLRLHALLDQLPRLQDVHAADLDRHLRRRCSRC